MEVFIYIYTHIASSSGSSADAPPPVVHHVSNNLSGFGFDGTLKKTDMEIYGKFQYRSLCIYV
jgi:hypothetical protein